MPAVASPNAPLARITRRAGRTQCFEGHAGRSCTEAGASNRLCSSCWERNMLLRRVLNEYYSRICVCQPQVLGISEAVLGQFLGNLDELAFEAERTSSWKPALSCAERMS